MNFAPTSMSTNRWACQAVVVLSLLASGCASTQLPPVSAPGVLVDGDSRVPPGVRWMRSSPEYEALVRQIYRHASEQLPRLVERLEAGTWAVALDADETILDNSQYQLERGNLGYTRKSWTKWCQRRAAGVLPGAKDFLREVRRLGGRIAIVTNRRANVQRDTEATFEALGLPYDVILTRPMDADRDKEPRWERLRRGDGTDLPPLRIVMWLGDDIEDFPGLAQSVAAAGEEAYAEFGRRYFVLPNPVYGSWEANPHR